MKGQFKEKLLRFLGHPVVSVAVKTIPLGIGSLLSNILDNVNGSKSGEIDKRTIAPILLKIAIYAALGLAITQGWLSVEDAEVIKDQIQITY